MASSANDRRLMVRSDVAGEREAGESHLGKRTALKGPRHSVGGEIRRIRKHCGDLVSLRLPVRAQRPSGGAIYRANSFPTSLWHPHEDAGAWKGAP
eukprot:2929240-Prorocentrum_lima.AAC.1